MSAAAFEDLVLDVLHAMGYGEENDDARLRVGGSGDAGIDGVIREDRLGLDVIYVQAKRWATSILLAVGHSRPSCSSARPEPTNQGSSVGA
jgi:restriction system protein